MNIVRGLPGSGKTTLAKGLSLRVSQAGTPSAVVSADMYFHKDTGKYDFDREELYRAHRWCQDTTNILLQDGIEVYVANTFLGFKEMASYLSYATLHNFGITLITANNDFGSVHEVSEETMMRFRNRIQTHDHIIDRYNEEFKCLLSNL